MLRQMANYYTIVFQWAHAVQLLLVAAAIVCVLTPLKAERRALLIGLAEFVGVFAACMLSEMFFFGLSAYSRALGGMCFPLALFVVIVLYAAVFCRFYARLRIIITSLLYACIVTVTVYVAQLTQIVEFPNLAALELTSIAVNLLVVFIAFVFTRFSIARFINIPDSAAVLAFFNSFFVVASVFVNYVLMSEVYGEFGLRQIGIVYTFVEGVVMFVMMLVAYCLIYIICKRNDLILELQAEEKMAESDRKLLDITQKNLADLRLLRHDIKNRYAYMAMLLDSIWKKPRRRRAGCAWRRNSTSRPCCRSAIRRSARCFPTSSTTPLKPARCADRISPASASAFPSCRNISISASSIRCRKAARSVTRSN